MENWKDEMLIFLKDKNINILGFGKEGKSVYKYIRKHIKDKRITISDKNDIRDNELLKNDNNIDFIIGEGYLDNLDSYDLILKSPGISFKNINYESFKDKIYSQIDIFLEFFPGYTISVTGTSGKSTTCAMFAKVLDECSETVHLLGNIGNPVFNDIDMISKNDYVVIELSSFALQYMKNSTDVAVLLNIYEDHLDNHVDLREYVNSKLNIFKNQEKGGIKIIQRCTKIMKDSGYDFDSENIINIDNIKESIKVPELFVPGEHNIDNAGIVKYVATEILNLDENKVDEGLQKYKGLNHRLEYVGEVDGIKYYNDSISTIPMATINAIKTIKDINTIIIGGFDKKIDLSDLINYLNNNNLETQNLKNVLLLPDTGHQMKGKIDEKRYNVHKVKDVEEAVSLCKNITNTGSVVLSPAAASYGYYKNFEDRGNRFKQAVLNNK